MKRREIVTCEPNVFPLDWLPAEILRELYVVRLSYFTGPDRCTAPIRYPSPEWEIPFRLVRAAVRMEFHALGAKVLASARVTAVSVRSVGTDPRQASSDFGHIVVLELELPDPPESQTPLDLDQT